VATMTDDYDHWFTTNGHAAPAPLPEKVVHRLRSMTGDPDVQELVATRLTRMQAGGVDEHTMLQSIATLVNHPETIAPDGGIVDAGEPTGAFLDERHEEHKEDEAFQPDPSWTPINLATVLASGFLPPTPTVCERRDGSPLFYERAYNGIHGVDGSGKSWLGLFAIAQEIKDGRGAVLVDLEDSEATTVARLRQIGVSDDDIANHLALIRPDSPLRPDEVREVGDAACDVKARIVIVDSLGEALALNGLDENSDAEMTPYLRLRLRPIAERGFAVTTIDHSVKSAASDPLWPSGSKRKRAAISGALYQVEAVQPFAVGQGGRMRITCAKDRHGTYRRGEHVADLVMEADGMLRLFEPPEADGAIDLPVELAARAAFKVLEGESQALSQRALLGVMKVTAGTETKRGGIELARDRGWIEEFKGKGGARMFRPCEVSK